jgi:hypothetical protein
MVLSDTSWGVVTMTAPSGFAFFSEEIVEICSSDVPGGVSMIKKSSFPQ